MQWRIRPVLPVTKLLGAVAIVVLAVAFAGYDPVRWGLAVIVATGLSVWALRDLVAPVRLTADHQGIVVLTGLLRRRRVPWQAVERVRVDSRTHRGLRSEMLEIDAGDAIFVFSANDLGAVPADVAAALADLRLRPAGSGF